jgi:MFS transporter, SP family, arabinose:H+ symporter
MKLTRTLLSSTVIAALGGLLFGFDTAVIAGTTETLEKLFALSPAWLGFTVSIALWGTVIGAMFAGIPGDKYGRRDSLKVMGVLFFVSAAGCAIAWDWYSLLVFRFIGGLGVGGASVLGPMYIAEIAPAKWRGRLVGFFQFNVVLGILVAYLSNAIIGTFELGDIEWRVKLGVEAAPALLFILALFPIPRSPRWLAKMQQIDEARKVLTEIGEENIEEELQDIVQSIGAEHGHAVEPLFQRKYFTPIMLAVTIAFFNQMSGINGLLYYLNDIFSKAGFDKVSGDIQSVIIGGTNLMFTMLAMSIIDKVGRKPLLLIGAIGTALCLSGVAAIFFLNAYQHLLVWCLVGYIAFFAFSQGAVIWVYIGEVFPNRVRAKGQSLGSFTHWIMCAIVAGTFPMMAEKSGGYPFVFFAVMMAVQFFVVWKYFIETRNITLEDMQKKLGIQ